MGERPPEREPSAVDPNASPWPVPPIVERILGHAPHDEEKAPAR